MKLNSKTIILANIYGYNSRTENNNLIETLNAKLIILKQMFFDAFVIGRDFNVVMNELIDRLPPGKASNANASLKR